MNTSAFWTHVDRTGPCWLWTASRSGTGYGQLWHGGRQVYAHRLAYELAVGELLPGEEVRHTYHNPLCVNPAHLIAGTHADNMHDMAAAHRARKRVLSPAAVARIRTEDTPATILAAEIGCTPTAIHMARRGETYRTTD